MTDALLKEIEILKVRLAQSEQDNARWVSARDIWDAERKRLKQQIDDIDRVAGRKLEEYSSKLADAEASSTALGHQLSASNAARESAEARARELESALNRILVQSEVLDTFRIARDALAMPQPTRERTPEQYAIEHGRYLATAAGLFMEACNALFSAEQELDKAEPDTQEEVDDLMAKTESAQEIRDERFRALGKAIYEFTKRADRAIQQEN